MCAAVPLMCAWLNSCASQDPYGRTVEEAPDEAPEASSSETVRNCKPSRAPAAAAKIQKCRRAHAPCFQSSRDGQPRCVHRRRRRALRRRGPNAPSASARGSAQPPRRAGTCSAGIAPQSGAPPVPSSAHWRAGRCRRDPSPRRPTAIYGRAQAPPLTLQSCVFPQVSSEARVPAVPSASEAERTRGSVPLRFLRRLGLQVKLLERCCGDHHRAQQSQNHACSCGRSATRCNDDAGT